MIYLKAKIVIGSIGAVLIFLLASCSSVVGAETNEKTTILKEIQNKQNIEKIKEMFNSVKEKINMIGSVDPGEIQPSCLLFFSLLESIIVVVYCLYLLWKHGPVYPW